MVDESAYHPISETSGVPGSTPASSRCVILTGPGGATPADLLSGLSRRAVSSRVVAEPADVMVALGQQRTGILIIVDPVDQPGLADLIEAVTKYHPRTVRWVYEARHASGSPQLISFQDRSRPTVTGSPPPLPEVEPEHEALLDAPSPLGRVQSQVPPERVRSLIVKVQGPAEVGEPLISEEELAMLLGPVPEDSGTSSGGLGDSPGEHGGDR